MSNNPLAPKMIEELLRQISRSGDQLSAEELAKLLVDNEQLTELHAEQLIKLLDKQPTQHESVPTSSRSNTPLTVPDSSLALTNSSSSTTKKVFHVFAFALILIVWYGSLLINPNENISKTFMKHHAISVILLSNANSHFLIHAYTPLIWAIEIAFAGVLLFALWRHSINVTLAILVFAICWSLVNYGCLLSKITIPPSRPIYE